MKKLTWIIVFGVIVSIGVGFWVGSKLNGSTPSPGSVFDPLVTQSYADKAVNDKVKELEDRLGELELITQVLENEVMALQEKAGIPAMTARPTTTQPATTSASGGTTNPSGAASSTTPSVSQAVPTDVIGQSASISSGNTVVNLRQSPSTSSTILKKLGPSDVFTIVKVDKDWYQIQMSDGTTGWVAGWLVTAK